MKGPIELDPVPEDAPEQEPASAMQRLRIHVPYLKTTLTMGDKAEKSEIRGDEDRGDTNFVGFGVTTQGHVFVDASGTAELGKDESGAELKSRMRLQSAGDLTVQTPSHLALGGRESAILASENNAFCAGGRGVAILGGDPFQWSDNQLNDAKKPDSPPWIANLKNTADAFNNFWSLIDASVAVASMLQEQSAEEVAGYGTHAPLMKAFVDTATLAGALSSFTSLSDGLNGTKLNPIGGTTVHGSGGLILGSGMTAGLYSLAGTTIFTPASVSIHASATDVYGSQRVVLSSAKHVQVQSETNASVVAAKNTLVTSREGVLSLCGPAINIGLSVDLPDLHQKATHQVMIVGEDAAIAADDVLLSGESTVTIATADAHIGATGAVRMGGGNALLLLESDKAVIGLAGSAPSLDKIKSYREKIASLQEKHDAVAKKLAKERDEGDSDSFWAELAQTKLSEYKQELAGAIDALKGDIAGLEHTKNSISFKSDGIEIVFEGSKMKIDSSSVKSGPIKWMTS